MPKASPARLVTQLRGQSAAIVSRNPVRHVERYLASLDTTPLLVCADSLTLLEKLPPECVDCVMTSPPYWSKRDYADGGIGLEADPMEYVAALLNVVRGIERVLKSTGSFWLNLGDSYRKKNLLGIPWRVAHSMTDTSRWTLRNDVIWHKVKGGPDNAKDKLRNTHEHLFHFVKRAQGYYYDAAAVRTPPKSSKVVKGAVVSATGVSGIRYQRQIELSTSLSQREKSAARMALRQVLEDLKSGRIADFRMVIRKQQRATHSDSGRVSGRARELEDKGFYFLKYHPEGSKLSDVWDVLPEDTQKRGAHFAPYPEHLCRVPLLATCPPLGVVLDPFCGTGTTMVVARELGRKSVGIDVSRSYLEMARVRCG